MTVLVKKKNSLILELSSDPENETDSSELEDFNEGSVLGLIEIVCIILNDNQAKLKTPQNLVYWENIKKRFNKSCSLFFRYFRVKILHFYHNSNIQSNQ